MAIITNERAGVGLAVLGLALVPFAIHEARAQLEWRHQTLWIAGPALLVIGIVMSTFPGSGPVGDDHSPALTPRERAWWIASVVVGSALGLAWSLALDRVF